MPLSGAGNTRYKRNSKIGAKRHPKQDQSFQAVEIQLQIGSMPSSKKNIHVKRHPIHCRRESDSLTDFELANRDHFMGEFLEPGSRKRRF